VGLFAGTIVEDLIYKYHRFSIRLTEYDYSHPGYYFITLVTQNRYKRFGVIINKKMQLNNIGRMIKKEWKQIPKRFKPVVLDEYIIMPDHFHGIIKIIPTKKPSEKLTLFEIIGAFKSITTHKYIDGVKKTNWPRFNKRLWQLRFHDHIIRNENELSRIRDYIIANPYNYHKQ